MTPEKKRGPVTFGEIDEVPPGPVSIEPPMEHTDYGWCWCQPTTLTVGMDGEVIVHRRSMDVPALEEMDR